MKDVPGERKVLVSMGSHWITRAKEIKRSLHWFSSIHHGMIRVLKEQTLDRLDAAYRIASGNGDLPPYTLRQFVGPAGIRHYQETGSIYVQELRRHGLIKPGDKVFDVGCGCGRIAHALAIAREFKVRYVGMDVDARAVAWCQKNITGKFPDFLFYQVDLYSKTYNPAGKVSAKSYVFPHADSEFDFILLTSIFTHLLPEDADHYLDELARVLKPTGSIYATFFTYKDKSEAVNGVARHPFRFKFYHETYAIADENRPEDAVAYHRPFLLELLARNGLFLKQPILEQPQDVLILGKGYAPPRSDKIPAPV